MDLDIDPMRMNSQAERLPFWVMTFTIVFMKNVIGGGDKHSGKIAIFLLKDYAMEADNVAILKSLIKNGLVVGGEI